MINLKTFKTRGSALAYAHKIRKYHNVILEIKKGEYGWQVFANKSDVVLDPFSKAGVNFLRGEVSNND